MGKDVADPILPGEHLRLPLNRNGVFLLQLGDEGLIPFPFLLQGGISLSSIYKLEDETV